jgi:predicted dehydrogenase
MEGGVVVTYTSRGRQNSVHEVGWGLTITGTDGVIRVQFSIPQIIQIRRRGGDTDCWEPMEGDPIIAGDTGDTANQRLVDDFVEAVATGGEPVCSGERAAKAQEMIAAVMAAGLARARVALPLAERAHPLGH